VERGGGDTAGSIGAVHVSLNWDSTSSSIVKGRGKDFSNSIARTDAAITDNEMKTESGGRGGRGGNGEGGDRRRRKRS